MNICRKINNKVFIFSLFPPIVNKPENVFIESNSKTNAITRIFESYCINPTTINNIKSLNNLSNNLLVVGQQLLISP